MNSVSNTRQAGIPFHHSPASYAAELRAIPTRDLLAEIEAWRWLALDVADLDDGSRAYVEFQLSAMVAELERRQQLLKARANDPLRPQWPADGDALQRRIETVSHAWPILRLCDDLLRMELIPAGAGRWKGRCPMVGHQDKTPSFYIDEEKNAAFCHGCGRGGGSIKVTQYALNLPRFTDALALLEREGQRP